MLGDLLLQVIAKRAIRSGRTECAMTALNNSPQDLCPHAQLVAANSSSLMQCVAGECESARGKLPL
jgi:hypothetical protein